MRTVSVVPVRLWIAGSEDSHLAHTLDVSFDVANGSSIRTCTVAVKDVQDVEHSIEVTDETLYEAIATALAASRRSVLGGGC